MGTIFLKTTVVYLSFDTHIILVELVFLLIQSSFLFFYKKYQKYPYFSGTKKDNIDFIKYFFENIFFKKGV